MPSPARPRPLTVRTLFTPASGRLAARYTPAAFRALFMQERARFAARYPFVAHATLAIVPREVSPYGRAWRDVAWASWRVSARAPGGITSMRVSFLRRALSLPRQNLIALIRHELGHLCDARRSEPGPGAEARADRIAARVGGRAIRYDTNDLQTLSTAKGTRARRPTHLHQ